MVLGGLLILQTLREMSIHFWSTLKNHLCLLCFSYLYPFWRKSLLRKLEYTHEYLVVQDWLLITNYPMPLKHLHLNLYSRLFNHALENQFLACLR